MIREYQGQPVTHDQLLLCIRWCQINLEVRDWDIKLDTGDRMPREFNGNEPDSLGMSYSWPNRNRALIWVPIDYLAKQKYNAISCTIHEVIHVMESATGVETNELMVRRMEPLLYRLYCKETKIKIAKERHEE